MKRIKHIAGQLPEAASSKQQATSKLDKKK